MGNCQKSACPCKLSFQFYETEISLTIDNLSKFTCNCRIVSFMKQGPDLRQHCTLYHKFFCFFYYNNYFHYDFLLHIKYHVNLQGNDDQTNLNKVLHTYLIQLNVKSYASCMYILCHINYFKSSSFILVPSFLQIPYSITILRILY